MSFITPALFQALIGKRITVDAEGGVELWRIESLRLLPPHALRQEPFALYLAAPGSRPPRQGQRRGVLPDGEPFDFFAVPIGQRDGEITYEVIYN